MKVGTFCFPLLLWLVIKDFKISPLPGTDTSEATMLQREGDGPFCHDVSYSLHPLWFAEYSDMIEDII